jgi:transcriptional regulator with XRE-family HTH domain
MLLSELGTALRKARKERRLTLKQVAEQAGVHFTTLSSLERGTISELGVRKLLRVAETLGLELVLRPAGQRFTLDDVAKERGGLLGSTQPGQLAVDKWAEHTKKFQDSKDRLLARALRDSTDGSSSVGKADQANESAKKTNR